MLNLAKSKKIAKQKYYEDKKDHNRSKSLIEDQIVKDLMISQKLNEGNLFLNTMVPQNNPISMIKNGIEKSYNIEEILKDKNKNISQSLGETYLPQLDDYQSKNIFYF